MVEGRAGGGANAGGGQVAQLGEVGKHPDLADVSARPDVVEHPFASGASLRDLHEPGADEIETVGRRVTLAEDHLARLEPQERDSRAELLDDPAETLLVVRRGANRGTLRR